MLINSVDATNDANHHTKPPPQKVVLNALEIKTGSRLTKLISPKSLNYTATLDNRDSRLLNDIRYVKPVC